RHQLPLLSDRVSPTKQSPGPRSGAFLFLASARSIRRRRGECRNRCRKLVEEFDEARMILPPRAGEAKITVAEHAGNRDLSDVRRRVAAGRRGFEGSERARHLAGLMLHPFRLVLGGVTPAPLIDLQ